MPRFSLLFFFIFSAALSFVHAQESQDSLVFQKFLDYAAKEKITEKETGERIILIARYFLDAPYVASTLEKEGPESLQVNLRELDCMTFVETVLALHNVLKESQPNFSTFKRVLTSIRYRNGIIDGYPSRLHYASDWLYNNVQMGFIQFAEMGRASETFRPEVGFMSTHPGLYPALMSHPEYMAEMARHEAHINTMLIKYLSKDKLTSKTGFIHSGDIIVIKTDIKGLDFTHLGFALRNNGEVYLLHASSTGKKVLISSQSLKNYLSDIKKDTGVVVVRPL